MRALVLCAALLAAPAMAQEDWGRVADWTKIDVLPNSAGSERLMLVFDKGMSRVDLVIYPNENLNEARTPLVTIRDFASNGRGPGMTPFLVYVDEERTWFQLIEERYDARPPFYRSVSFVFEEGRARVIAYRYEEFQHSNGAEFSCELFSEGDFSVFAITSEDAEDEVEIEGTYSGEAIYAEDGFRTAPMPAFCRAPYEAWRS